MDYDIVINSSSAESGEQQNLGSSRMPHTRVKYAQISVMIEEIMMTYMLQPFCAFTC